MFWLMRIASSVPAGTVRFSGAAGCAATGCCGAFGSVVVGYVLEVGPGAGAAAPTGVITGSVRCGMGPGDGRLHKGGDGVAVLVDVLDLLRGVGRCGLRLGLFERFLLGALAAGEQGECDEACAREQTEFLKVCHADLLAATCVRTSAE